jgi:hypothetical protein
VYILYNAVLYMETNRMDKKEVLTNIALKHRMIRNQVSNINGFKVHVTLRARGVCVDAS